MEKAMATIHSQPHLSSLLRSYRDPEDDDDNGSSSSGELLRGGKASSGGGRRSSSSLRRRSCGDVVLPAAAGGGARRSSKLPRLGGMIDEQAAEAYFYISAAPGYVSFEDVIGPNALYRDGSGRPLEAAISDPLMSTVSRLQPREDGGSRRRRQESPGPLGTRRGSTMHGFVKKYVHPLQGFLRGIICCIIPSAS